MGRDTMFSCKRCSFLALLLGMVACGDGSAVVMAPPSDGAATPEASDATEPPAPDVTNLPGATSGDEGSPAPEPGPTSAPESSNGADQPAVPADPESASSGGSNEAAPSSADPADEEPAPGEPVSEEPSPEDGPSEPVPSEEPSASGPLARGDDPTRQSAIAPGPFGVAIVTAGLRDGPDYGSQTLHVPEGVEPPFAAVVIVPGRDELESSIQAWGPFLASHGIVALTIGTNDPGDGPDARASALLDALETLRAENRRAGGPLEGELALDHLGVMGWSAGGAGVLRVASSTPSLGAAIAMAPYSPGGQFPEDRVPTLLLAGSADPRAGGQSQGVFESLPETTPKMLFEVEAGEHEIGNDPENAEGEIGLYGLSWLEVFLVGDERYRVFLEETPRQASDFEASWGDDP